MSRSYCGIVLILEILAQSAMWNTQLKSIAGVEGFAGAAILCSVVSQHIYSRNVQSELASETLCWLILPFLFKFTKPRETNRFSSIPRSPSKSQSPSSSSIWIVAASIAVASIYKAEIGVIGLSVS